MGDGTLSDLELARQLNKERFEEIERLHKENRGLKKQLDEDHTMLEQIQVAKSRDAVERFYNKALELGAKDNGKPGLRDYEAGYFAAFVIDPNGHNIEAVYSEQEA